MKLGCRLPRRYYVIAPNAHALSDGVPALRGVLVAGPRYAACLPTLRLNQSPAHSAGVAHWIAGKVNSSGKLYLVIESAQPDTRHVRFSNVPALVDGAGGSPID